jgi:hypothetical protein
MYHWMLGSSARLNESGSESKWPKAATSDAGFEGPASVPFVPLDEAG